MPRVPIDTGERAHYSSNERAPNDASFQEAKMSTLSLREQLLVGSILAAALLGMTVKHFRDARREAATATAGVRASP